ELALLVRDRVAHLDRPSVGLSPRRDRLRHLEAHAHLVARPHGPEPAQLVDAWRAEARAPVHEALDGQALDDRRRVPAARDEAAEGRASRRLVVQVEGLRVELAREGDDLLAGHDASSELGYHAGPEVLEVEHAEKVIHATDDEPEARPRDDPADAVRHGGVAHPRDERPARGL